MAFLRHVLITTFLLATGFSFGQSTNGLCANAQMFCSGSLSQLPAGVNTGYAQLGPYYGCFVGLPGGNLPNPAWFIIPISQTGQVVFNVSGISDVDFVTWGPFSSPSGNCNNLTAATIVPNSGGNHGCASSPSATETLILANAHAGDYYVMVMSNYWNVSQQISFVQTNITSNSGAVGILSLNGTDSLCSGQTATVQLTGGNNVQSITWNGPSGNLGSSYFQTFPNLTATSVYTVIGTAVGNQTCSVTKTIKVLPNPAPVIAGSGTICSGATASFSVTGGSSYSWSGPGIPFSTSANLSIPNAQPANSGVYSVLAYSNTCTGSSSVGLVVNQTPTVTVTSAGDFCAGKSFSLSVSGASTYSWTGPNGFTFQGQNPVFSNNSSSMSGLYTASGETNGCAGNANINVAINPIPTLVLTVPGNVCSGTTANFTVSGGTSYSWSGPGSFSSNAFNLSLPNVQQANAGTYSVLTSLNSCTATTTGNLAVIQSPTLTVTSNGNYCAGKSFSLTANGASTYTWTGPNGFTFQGQHPVFSNNALTLSGQYIATGEVNGCSSNANITVTINPLPTISILTSGSGTACVGVPISFTATGGTSYLWSGPAAFLSGSATPSIPAIQYNNSGTYSVLATLNTCTALATKYLAVNINPTVTVSQAGDLCSGKSFSLLSQGATTYTWSGPNAFTFQGTNPLFVNTNLNMSGLYTLTGEANGCYGSVSVNISIHPLPNVTASTSGSVCQSSSITLTAGGADTYVWTGPNSYSSQQPKVIINNSTPATSGVYTVTGTDLNSCVNTATVYQQVQPDPYVNIYSADACVNANIILSSSGGAAYHWEGPASFSSNDQNPVVSNASTFNAGVYTVTVTSLYGCSASASVPVSVFLNPVVSVSGNIEVCKGQDFSFKAQGALNYKWLNSTGIVTQNSLFSISSISPELETTYTLVGIDGHSCPGLIPFYPIVNQLPAARIIPDVTSGCAPLCTNITLDLLSPNITAASWKFSDGQTITGTSTSTVNYSKCLPTPGIYTLNVQLTDAKTCTSVVTNSIEAYASPKADFSYTPDQPTENDNVVTFTDQSKNSSTQSWSWNFYSAAGSLKDTSSKQSPTLTYSEVGNYLVYLKVTSANGCSDSITKILVLAEDPTFFIPNAFTPNGDGLNDVFVPKSRAVVNYQMQVFTRWGELLYSSIDPTKGWDGKSGSDVLPTDTYVYKFTVSNADKNPKVYKGQFTLIK